MSASPTPFPDPNWPRQDPTRPDFHLPPDPLLDSSSFIAPSSLIETLTGSLVSGRDLHRNDGRTDSFKTPRSSLNGMSLPKSSDFPSSRNTDASSKTTSAIEKPNWLPANWIVEDRVRSSGATAGTVDRYYFDPVSRRKFRSKIEVLYFLETGTLRKRKKDGNPTPADTSEENKNKNKKPTSSIKPTGLNFDFHNVPEKVEWVLADTSEESWTPFINNQKVPESTKREWDKAFSLLGHTQSKV